MSRTSKSPLKKSTKPSGQELVIEFMTNIDHPLKTTIIEVREIILEANEGITEHIKWNAPSFCFQGDDRITFNLSRKECIMIIFHRGAKVRDNKGTKPLINDTTGLLEWLAQDRGVIKFYNLMEAEESKAKLKKLVKQWIAATSG